MTVVSSKEFVSNEDKYFDMAIHEQVFVKRNNIMFLITRANDNKKTYLEPDDDLRRAITGEELLNRICHDIEIKFANRSQ
jgi:hypothetical protein